MFYGSSTPSDHTIRLLDYIDNLSNAGIQAEKERYARDEPYARECSWNNFIQKCVDCQIKGSEPSRTRTSSGSPFDAAYWNLDERVVATLTSTAHANSMAAPVTQPRVGGDDRPPPYASATRSTPATPLPPYETIPALSIQARQSHQRMGVAVHQERYSHSLNNPSHSSRRDDYTETHRSEDRSPSPEWSGYVRRD